MSWASQPRGRVLPCLWPHPYGQPCVRHQDANTSSTEWSLPLFMVLTVSTSHFKKWAIMYICWGEFPESWFECRRCGKMEGLGAWDGCGVPAGGKVLPWEWGRHTGWASKLCQGFFLTVYPLVCLPLCLLLPDDFALWDFGPWRPQGKVSPLANTSGFCVSDTGHQVLLPTLLP